MKLDKFLNEVRLEESNLSKMQRDFKSTRKIITRDITGLFSMINTVSNDKSFSKTEKNQLVNLIKQIDKDLEDFEKLTSKITTKLISFK